MLLGLMALQTLVFLAGVRDIPVWRHDSIYHARDYADKLRTEGRWLICLLFGTLRRIPAPGAWLGSHLLHALFFYRVALPVMKHRRAAAVFALLGLQCMPVQAASLWPGIALCSGLTLSAALALQRLLPPLFFFMATGMIMAGAYQHYYLLMPLLMLETACERGPGMPRRLFTMAGLWALGFCIGHAFSSAMLRALAGIWTPEIAAWRHPRPARTPGDLLANLVAYAGTAARDFRSVIQGPAAGILLPGLAGLRLGMEGWKPLARMAAVCVPVALSLYLILSPSGVEIPGRTALPMFAGVLALAGLARQASARQALATCILLYGLFGVYLGINRANLVWYTSVTGTYIRDLDALADRFALPSPRLIVVQGNARRYQRRIEAEQRLPSPRVMSPVLSHGAGDADIHWAACARASRFSEVVFRATEAADWFRERSARIDTGRCLNEHPNLCVHAVDLDGWMLLSLR